MRQVPRSPRRAIVNRLVRNGRDCRREDLARASHRAAGCSLRIATRASADRGVRAIRSSTSIPIIWQIVQIGLLKWRHCREPFLARQLFHIVQGLWGDDPAILLIELWKLPLRSAQPALHYTQYPAHILDDPYCHKDILIAVRRDQH